MAWTVTDTLTEGDGMDLDELIELLEKVAEEHGGHLWVERADNTQLRDKDVKLVYEDDKPAAVQIG